MTPKTHQGVHIKFNELFVKSGEFSIEYGQKLTATAELIGQTDYDGGTEISKKIAKIALENARFFLEGTKKWFEKK